MWWWMQVCTRQWSECRPPTSWWGVIHCFRASFRTTVTWGHGAWEHHERLQNQRMKPWHSTPWRRLMKRATHTSLDWRRYVMNDFGSDGKAVLLHVCRISKSVFAYLQIVQLTAVLAFRQKTFSRCWLPAISSVYTVVSLGPGIFSIQQYHLHHHTFRFDCDKYHWVCSARLWQTRLEQQCVVSVEPCKTSINI